MEDMETIKNINAGIRSVMMPMYNELVKLRDQLNSLSGGPEYRSAKVRFDDLSKRYNILYETNSKIVKCTSKNEVKNELQRIINEREILYKEFVSLKKEYDLAKKNGVSVNELNKITNKARQISPIINCYDKLIEVFNKTLGNVKSNKEPVVQKQVESKPSVVTETRQKVQQTEVKQKKQKKLEEYIGDPDIRIIYMLNKKIQMLKNELFNHAQGSPKAKFINKQIYELCEQREKMVTDLLGTEAISKIAVIESMEDAAYSKANIVPIKSYSVTAEEYNEELDDLISILGDLKFNEFDSETYKKFRASEEKKASEKGVPYTETENQTYKKVYEIAVRKYKNLLNSVIGEDKSLSSMKDDLLNSLSAFNLTGGYAAFKKKHKNGKIGGSAISRDVYTDGTKKIKDLISSLETYATKYIAKKGGKITVVDSEKTRGQMIEEVNGEYAKLFEQIEARKEKTVESRA